MKTSSILVAGSALATAFAHPLSKRQDANVDVDVLQFALTLEHLENAFYKQALSTLSEEDFMNANFTPQYYSNLKYIAHDEESHVTSLSAALSAAGVMNVAAACDYKFPFTDVASFITLSSVLEGVGTSAYLGGAPLITSKEYLAVAGSILVTESLHTSLQRAAAKEVPFPNPYGTALTPSPVFSIAASFITSCPMTNPTLPFMMFPALTAVQGTPAAPGIMFEFSVMGDVPSNGTFVTFVSGLTTMSMPVMDVTGSNFKAMVPDMASGQTYALLTNANITTLADSAIVAGPAILEVTPSSPTFDVSVM